MNINLIPLAVVGAVLIVGVIILAVWRKAVSAHEDDSIHILEDGAMVQTQMTVASKLKLIDRLGKTLTVITVLYVVGFFGLYFYQVWMQGSTATGV